MIKIRYPRYWLYNFFKEIDYLPDHLGLMTLLSLVLPGVVLIYSSNIALSFFGVLWMLVLTTSMINFRAGKFDPKDNKNE